MIEIISQLQILFIVVIASCLGGVVGIERELHARSAGLRTHVFIAAISAALVQVGVLLALTFGAIPDFPEVRVDPLRIIQAIVVGIGFVGAGVILKDEDNHKVHNLTTAASILFTAVVGIVVGLELFVLAIGMSAIALIVNFGLLVFEKRQFPYKKFPKE